MPEAGDSDKRTKSKAAGRSTLDASSSSNSATTVDGNGSVLTGTRLAKMPDGCATSSEEESPPETERRNKRSLSRPSSKGQSHSSAFSAASSRPQMPAFPMPFPTMPMASASTSFNYHPPLAINSRTNSGRYSFESLTGNNENGNWRPGSGSQLPTNPLWYPNHQFGLNPYFSFGPYYAATPNYAEAMRQMMPSGGSVVAPNGFSESSSENSRAPSPRNRKRALSTSPGSDIMSLFSEIIRSTSNSLRPVGLHSDLNSRCSSSTSLGSFSHLSAGTISPTALYASPYQCRTPFFAPNMHNFGAKMPSVASTPGASNGYPFPLMLPMPTFVKPDQTSGSFGVPASMLFPGYHSYPMPANNNNVSSTDSTPSPIKQDLKVTPSDNGCAQSKCDKTKTSQPSLHRRSTSSSVADVDNEHLKSLEDLTETTLCQWDSCNLQLESQHKLVEHINHNHIKSQKDHICKWVDCNRERKPFKAQYMLVVHMRHHTGEKPHKCSYENCTKAYGRLENLKTHLRSHTGDKPYRCEVQGCGKSFSNASDRAKHQNRTHSNEKPYACTMSGCTKRYTDPSSLRKHIKTVHGIEAYQNKRRKRVDSDHDSHNGDTLRDPGLSTDVLRSKDENDSRVDPNGSVQSSNVDSPGTYSNPTDEFCASVSPQGNDSGVEMNVASDSLSCAMESMYSPEIELEMSEPLNVLLAVGGDGDDELLQMDRPNRLRQRIALKPTLPTIPSGIPYDAERRVAEFVAAHQNHDPVCTTPQAFFPSRTGAVCASSGQQPLRPNKNFALKSPPTAKRRESTSSLASSIYSSIKSDFDTTSYPAFSDCSRPDSVMSSVSVSFERARNNSQQLQQSQPSYRTTSARSPVTQNVPVYHHQPSNNFSHCDRFEDNNERHLKNCRFQSAQTYFNDNCRHSMADNSFQKTSSFFARTNGTVPWSSTQLSPNRSLPSNYPSNSCCSSSYCQHQCQSYDNYISIGPSMNRTITEDCSRTAFKEHVDKSMKSNVGCFCSTDERCTIDNKIVCGCCSRLGLVNNVCRNIDQNDHCVCVHPHDHEDSRHHFTSDYRSDSSRGFCPNTVRHDNGVSFPSCREDFRGQIGETRPLRRLDCTSLNRSLMPIVQQQPVTANRLVVRADVHGCDFPLNSMRSNSKPVLHSSPNEVQPEFDLSCLTFRTEQEVPSAPIESIHDEFERPPTVMERRMQAQSQTLYQPSTLGVTAMDTNLANYLAENQMFYANYIQSLPQ